MLSCTNNIEIHAELEDVWSKLAELEFYPNWSPCFAFVKNISPHSVSFVDSRISFNMVRFKNRIKRIATIKEFTAPYLMTFSFACPYRFWLEEYWVITLQPKEQTVIVQMDIRLSGWTHVKTYQHESHMIQAFCEAHLEALKVSLEELDRDLDDGFFLLNDI